VAEREEGSRSIGEGELLSTGDMARLGGTTLRTVRFYEEEGLITPAARSEGGHRMFSHDELHKLQLVGDLRECGLSLCDIKALFELKARCPSAEDASTKLSDLLEQQIDQMQKRIPLLRRLREELASAISVLRECHSCHDTTFPTSCKGCDVLTRPDLPRAVRLLWND
jgi:DNA-binding transcriptional MerR regulator